MCRNISQEMQRDLSLFSLAFSQSYPLLGIRPAPYFPHRLRFPSFVATFLLGMALAVNYAADCVSHSSSQRYSICAANWLTSWIMHWQLRNIFGHDVKTAPELTCDWDQALFGLNGCHLHLLMQVAHNLYLISKLLAVYLCRYNVLCQINHIGTTPGTC